MSSVVGALNEDPSGNSFVNEGQEVSECQQSAQMLVRAVFFQRAVPVTSGRQDGKRREWG